MYVKRQRRKFHHVIFPKNFGVHRAQRLAESLSARGESVSGFAESLRVRLKSVGSFAESLCIRLKSVSGFAESLRARGPGIADHFSRDKRGAENKPRRSQFGAENKPQQINSGATHFSGRRPGDADAISSYIRERQPEHRLPFLLWMATLST